LESIAGAPGLAPFDTPLWDPAFWPARYLASSSWIEHVPFAFWLVSATRPALIVEVGTESGVSYFAFCQAVEQLSLETRCYAVDTRTGDQASSGDDDFANNKSYNDDHYSPFSTLIKSTSANAAAKFDDNSIDLLHLKLRVGANNAWREIGSWLPKISPSGILVLAHTNSAESEIGVRKEFNELKKNYPTFEFMHGEGLGIVGIGPRRLEALSELLPPASDEMETRWRKCFARLGRGLLDRHLLETEIKHRGQRSSPVDAADTRKKHQRETAALQREIDDLKQRLAQAQSIAATDTLAKTAASDALATDVQHLRQELAEEKRRFRARLRENEQLKIALRNVRQDTQNLKSAEKLMDALRNDIAQKASSLARMGNRIAALKDEIRRSDRYVAQLLSHFEKKKGKVERRLVSLVNRIKTDTDLEAVRTTILRHESAPSLKVLAEGVRASTTVEKTLSRRAVYLHYRYKQGRKDASQLAMMAASGLFDPKYYFAHYEDVARENVDPLLHYVDYGAAERRDPSPYFDTSHYLETYPDVAEQGINPLLHFITRGREEGRSPKPTPSIKGILGDWTPPPAPPERVSRDALKPLPKRVVIYTAVSGSYDDLKPPAFRPPHCDFVVFSDQPLDVEGWQVRPLNYLHPDPTRAARFVKLHPHLYFPDYEHSIWLDGNIGVHGDIREFFRRLKDDMFLGIFVHPLRDCIYVEGDECIKRKKDDPEIINRHVARYREAGFPEKSGLWETNVVIRRHNDPRCIETMTEWWREMEIGSRRDQISLPVVAKRLSVEIAGLGAPQVDARNHPMLSLVKHPGRREVDHDVTLPAAPRKFVDFTSISMDIGICVHNSPDETRACLNSVAAARRPNDCIIIVDDASAQETATYLDEFAAGHDNVKLVRHEANRGYTASANAVLKNSTGDWVVLLNSDAVLAQQSLRKMIETGEQFPQIGIVGALSNAASWQTVPQLTGSDGKFLVNQIPLNLTIDDMDRICEEAATGVVPFVPLVNGFCYAVRRKLIERIGYFDEESFPQGYGEEDDFCLRAAAAGFLCAVATDAYVFHVKSATFTSDRRKPLVESGVEALRRKHTPERLKAAVETLKRHPEMRRIRGRIAEQLRNLSPPLVPAD